MLPIADAAPCPHCHGNAPSCTYAADKKCPLITIVAQNASIVVGAATAALTLANLIRPRFLRAFPSSALDATASHLKRPAPGTPFVIEADTKIKDILTAITSRQFTMELAFVRISELIDELDPSKDADKLVIARLERNIKILGSAKEVEAFTSSNVSSGDNGGVFSFI